MENDKKSIITQMLCILGKIIAVIMIIRYALLIVHTYYPFLPNGIVMDILSYINLYAPIALVIVVALSAIWDKSDILKLIMLIICTAIVIFSFFPAVRETIEQFAGIVRLHNTF